MMYFFRIELKKDGFDEKIHEREGRDLEVKGKRRKLKGKSFLETSVLILSSQAPENKNHALIHKKKQSFPILSPPKTFRLLPFSFHLTLAFPL